MHAELLRRKGEPSEYPASNGAWGKIPQSRALTFGELTVSELFDPKVLIVGGQLLVWLGA
jgi:hypothetical protein